MHPVLFESAWFTANAYGTLILLGGLVAVPGTVWDARTRGVAPGSLASFIVDYWLAIVFGAAIGGRLLHVATSPTAYVSEPFALVSPQNTGFVFFGSLLAIIAGWAFLARRYATSFAGLCDLGATWIPLGHAFGRLGCTLAGCCWGAPTSGAWGWSFPPESVVYAAAPELHAGASGTVALHPVQAYESLGLLGVFGWMLATRIRRGVQAPWRQASRYLVAYGLLRFTTEIFRGDHARGFIVELSAAPLSRALGLPLEQPLALSVSQALALVGIALGAVGLWRTRRQS